MKKLINYWIQNKSILDRAGGVGGRFRRGIIETPAGEGKCSIAVLTGTESSADKSVLLLAEKTESEPGSDSEWVDQMVGNELAESPPFAGGKPASTSSTGKSRRSSIWSKKLPQSISSTKLFPIILSNFCFFIFHLQKTK